MPRPNPSTRAVPPTSDQEPTPAGAAARRALAMLFDCQALVLDIRAVGDEPDGPLLSDHPMVAAARQVWRDGSGFAARYRNLVARLADPVPADALDALRAFRAADRGMDGVTWPGGPLGLVAELSAAEAVEALARRFLMEIDQAVRDEYPPARGANPSRRPDLTGPQYVPVRHRAWASGRCPVGVFTGDNYALMWRAVRAEGVAAARAVRGAPAEDEPHPDGPDGGCWVWWQGTRHDVPKGVVYKFIAHFWARDSSTYATLNKDVFDGPVDPGSVRKRTSEVIRTPGVNFPLPCTRTGRWI